MLVALLVGWRDGGWIADLAVWLAGWSGWLVSLLAGSLGWLVARWAGSVRISRSAKTHEMENDQAKAQAKESAITVR